MLCYNIPRMKGFIEFVRTQGVAGLAVGFILGSSVSKVVSSLVDDIINPMLSIIFGATETLAELTFNVGRVQIAYGNFLSVLLDFLIVALVVYYIVTVFRLDKDKIKVKK